MKKYFKCNLCGNIIELTHEGGGSLVCCNQPMNILTENTQDAAVEKHVPIIEKTETGVRVIVGEIEHPMEDAHYIQWIEIVTEKKSYRKFLQPGDTPVAEFIVQEEVLYAREYCNLHGLWKS